MEGKQWQEVADTLSIGGRQLRRDRAVALEALSSILRDRYPSSAPAAAASIQEDPLGLESGRVARHREPTDLAELVVELLPMLDILARYRQVRLGAHLAVDLPRPHLNRTLMRHTLISWPATP